MVVMKKTLKKIILRINFLESHMVSSTEQSEVHIEPSADPSIRLRQGFAGQVRLDGGFHPELVEGQDVYSLILLALLLTISNSAHAIFD